MSFLRELSDNLVRAFWKEEGQVSRLRARYSRFWRFTVFITAAVSITPLVIMTAINYHQYEQDFKAEIRHPLLRLASVTKRSLEVHLEERKSALRYIVQERSFEDLGDRDELSLILRNLKNSFGEYVDLGLIDSSGKQRAYVGPYELAGADYKDEEWFHELKLHDAFISDVYLGYRRYPHFLVAVKHEDKRGGFYILRATINTDFLRKQVITTENGSFSDSLIINRKGVLQTGSRHYGDVLEKVSLDVPPYSRNAAVLEKVAEEGGPYFISYAYVENSPFIFMMIKRPKSLQKGWLSLRGKLLVFLFISVIVIVLLVMALSSILVSLIRESDRRRDKILHQVEYTNKMASIGRLASGVAHEINNPLAIINEKAGLLKDLATLSDDFPNKERTIKILDSVLQSVERCSTITHRLLGFARHMDLENQTIDLRQLINEVLGFLEKEAMFRNIEVKYLMPGNLPPIVSDRGRLQQVFLNIINNAFAAVDDGGEIQIGMEVADGENITVTITDNGHGMSEEDMKRIFEPFFTTRHSGTGLGLSITYGIVEKLGGKIQVASKVGEGTSFAVTLPIHKI